MFDAGIKPGRIPGTKNLPFLNMIDQDKKIFRSSEEIKQHFDKVGIDLTKPLVTTCGSGKSEV